MRKCKIMDIEKADPEMARGPLGMQIALIGR